MATKTINYLNYLIIFLVIYLLIKYLYNPKNIKENFTKDKKVKKIKTDKTDKKDKSVVGDEEEDVNDVELVDVDVDVDDVDVDDVDVDVEDVDVEVAGDEDEDAGDEDEDVGDEDEDAVVVADEVDDDEEVEDDEVEEVEEVEEVKGVNDVKNKQKSPLEFVDYDPIVYHTPYNQDDNNNIKKNIISKKNDKLYKKNILSDIQDKNSIKQVSRQSIAPDDADINWDAPELNLTEYTEFKKSKNTVDVNKKNVKYYNAKDYLPKEVNDEWFDTDFSQAQHNIKDDKLINTDKYVTGIDTVGQSLKNPTYDIRGTIPNPKISVSPWNNSTYEPDYNLKSLC